MNEYEQVMKIVLLSASAAFLIVALIAAAVMVIVSLHDARKNRKEKKHE